MATHQNFIQHQHQATESHNSEPESKGRSLNPPAFQLKASNGPATPPPTQQESGSGGLPADLVSGFAASTGHDLSDVNVVRNSDQPVRVGALAYAQGNDIHLAAGQDQHLAHEAAHIVQQREGRVSANTKVGEAPVNDSKALENEADAMGKKAMQMKGMASGEETKRVDKSDATQRKVIQKKDVPTDFGKFSTTKFEKIGEEGVSCILDFEPAEDKVDAKKIGLTQAVKATSGDGSSTAIDPTKENQRVKSGDGKDFAIDRLSNQSNPVYGADNLGNGEGLDKTKDDNNTSGLETKVAPFTDGGNATYQLGYNYLDGKDRKKKNAILHDAPKGNKTAEFETTALGLEGTDKDKYFGSVKWGYKVDNGKVEINDIEIASKGNPSVNFQKAAEHWNSSKTRGTLEVTGDPATVLAEDQRTRATLGKGTKVKQIRTIDWNGASGVQVEELDAAGKGTGKKYYIKVVDLKDLGDGGKTTELPIPK